MSQNFGPKRRPTQDFKTRPVLRGQKLKATRLMFLTQSYYNTSMENLRFKALAETKVKLRRSAHDKAKHLIASVKGSPPDAATSRDYLQQYASDYKQRRRSAGLRPGS
jgi:hypothetical protein